MYAGLLFCACLNFHVSDAALYMCEDQDKAKCSYNCDFIVGVGPQCTCPAGVATLARDNTTCIGKHIHSTMHRLSCLLKLHSRTARSRSGLPDLGQDKINVRTTRSRSGQPDQSQDN